MPENVSKREAFSKRHGGLDVLRALAALFVVVNHATFLPVGSGMADKWSTAIIYAIVFPAVPIFVMMSGAFILNNDRNRNAWAFYWHSIKKLFPTCSVVFVVYFSFYTKHPEQFIQGNESISQLLSNFWSWFEHGASAPLWYVCVLPGLYLVAPLLVFIRQKTTWHIHVILCVALFGISCRSLRWGLLCPWNAVGWLYWFVLGMILMNHAKKVKSAAGIRLATAATVCVVAAASVRLFLLMNSTDDFYSLQYSAYQDVVNSIVAVCMFALFVQLKDWTPNWLVSKFAELSLLIYLTHMLVLRLLMCVMYHIGIISELHHSYTISFLYGFLAVVFTFMLSWGVKSASSWICAVLSALFARSGKACQ